MSHDIHQKIAKLLKLAKGSGATPHEAAAAAGRAQALMERHRLSMADLTDMADVVADDDAIAADQDPLWRGGRSVVWVSRLATGVAYLNNCCLLSATGRRDMRFHLAGHPDDIRVVRAIFSYLRREIERLGRESLNTPDFTLWSVSGGRSARTWTNNFRLGAVAEVCRRLHLDKIEARSAFARLSDASVATRAIVHVDGRREAVQRWVDTKTGGKVSTISSRSQFDLSARAAGAQAGGAIVDSMRTSLPSGSQDPPP